MHQHAHGRGSLPSKKGKGRFQGSRGRLLSGRGTRKYLNFSTITEIPGRDLDFDQKLILAARGQLNGGDGMRGRRDLGGRWPACYNALHSGTYMDAQRVMWALRGMLSRSRLHPAWSFFSKRKSTGAHPGSQRPSVAKQVSFDPNVGTTRKRLECRPIGPRPESRRWSKADFTTVPEGPPPPFGRPDTRGP